jgi:hypothetical protein
MSDPTTDALLALWGSGKQIWADEHADDYIRRLREGWDETPEPGENPHDSSVKKAVP